MSTADKATATFSIDTDLRQQWRLDDPQATEAYGVNGWNWEQPDATEVNNLPYLPELVNGKKRRMQARIVRLDELAIWVGRGYKPIPYEYFRADIVGEANVITLGSPTSRWNEGLGVMTVDAGNMGVMWTTPMIWDKEQDHDKALIHERKFGKRRDVSPSTLFPRARGEIVEGVGGAVMEYEEEGVQESGKLIVDEPAGATFDLA